MAAFVAAHSIPGAGGDFAEPVSSAGWSARRTLLFVAMVSIFAWTAIIYGLVVASQAAR